MALAMDPANVNRLFDAENMRDLSAIADVDFNRVTNVFTQKSVEALKSIDVLLTGWGAPRIEEAHLKQLPGIKLITHAAGSLKPILDESAWNFALKISSAAKANAIPVAEYSVATILLSGKGAFEARNLYARRRGVIDQRKEFSHIGNFRRTLGIVGASTIGRLVISMLKETDLEIIVSDPFLSESESLLLGVRKVELEELFETSDVVSIHAPLLPSTEKLVSESLLQRMKYKATLINTSRGAIVDQEALIDVLKAGRIYAVIDTTFPEVLESDSRLFSMENVFLTPHIAGALGNEIARLGAFVINEIKLFKAGQGLNGEVSLEQFKFMA